LEVRYAQRETLRRKRRLRREPHQPIDGSQRIVRSALLAQRPAALLVTRTLAMLREPRANARHGGIIDAPHIRATRRVDDLQIDELQELGRLQPVESIR